MGDGERHVRNQSISLAQRQSQRCDRFIARTQKPKSKAIRTSGTSGPDGSPALQFRKEKRETQLPLEFCGGNPDDFALGKIQSMTKHQPGINARSVQRDILIYADSEKSADMLYAVGIFVPDPFIFFIHKGRSFMVVGDLEIDRARATATVDEVICLSEIQCKGRGHSQKKGSLPGAAEVIASLFAARKMRTVDVPADFPLLLAGQLARKKIKLNAVDKIFAQREFKSADELRMIEAALRMTEAGLKAGIDLISRAKIFRTGKKGQGYLSSQGEKLTSQRVRAEIDSTIVRLGGLPAHTIVAGGDQACDPHERGAGILRPDQTIILDIFPRDQKSGYFGDMTRTIVRGKAPENVRKMFETVRQGQKIALDKMKPGADGRLIHEEIKDYFSRQGFPTEIRRGRQSGFFHGTGHGIGLEIHESPRFGTTIFEPGQVITVEPGLYYRGIGGIRIEDVAVVTKSGNRVLSKFPVQLEYP